MSTSARQSYATTATSASRPAAPDRRGRHRHRPRRLHRHAGPAAGQAAARAYFLDVVLEHGTEGCNYLLAVDVDMNTVDGYAMSSWDRGYGDFVMRRTCRRSGCLPHQPGTAMVLADLGWQDQPRRAPSPRQC